MVRDDIKKVMIIGSGPIVIGQACEFDYSGTQACKALRECGYKIVLVNSNPATIMTDPVMADATYIEPLNVERLEQIIEIERPDALLPNLGGQTGLNLSLELARAGVLDRYGVKATFFTVQFWAEEHPDYLKKIDEAGHEIGTHSATHPKMSQLSEEAIKTELTTSSRAITEVTGKQVTLFRPPFGDYDNAVIDTSRALGLMPIQWDVDTLDWKDLSAKEIAERVVSKAKSGSIILCHNNGLHTAEALPVILDTLHARGFTFVPVGELIYRENYTIDHTGRQFSAAKG